MGIELINEIQEKSNTLTSAITELKKRGRIKSITESEFRIALATKLLELRDLGHPVTIIGDIARGNRDIAELRLKRDIAETEYNVALEFINVTKLQIRILENQIGREWGNSK
jgi:hypothetical protein